MTPTGCMTRAREPLASSGFSPEEPHSRRRGERTVGHRSPPLPPGLSTGPTGQLPPGHCSSGQGHVQTPGSSGILSYRSRYPACSLGEALRLKKPHDPLPAARPSGTSTWSACPVACVLLTEPQTSGQTAAPPLRGALPLLPPKALCRATGRDRLSGRPAQRFSNCSVHTDPPGAPAERWLLEQVRAWPRVCIPNHLPCDAGAALGPVRRDRPQRSGVSSPRGWGLGEGFREEGLPYTGRTTRP